jgi:uncharacterized protein (DUF2236 family)
VLRIPHAGSMVRLLRWPSPIVTGSMPLRDPTPDPGLFGPGSVTWRVMREPALMAGAGRALLMQAAHPLVAQGAIDHSAYQTDPFGRFERTVLWVTLVSFGTTAEARRTSRGVNALHRRVVGRLPREHATPRVTAGTRYTARDPHLLRWVHASFVDTMLSVHSALVGGLSDWDRDRFVLEWNAVASLMGVPERLRFSGARQLEDYVLRQVRRGRAVPGAGSRRVAETVLHPPVSSRLARPGMELMAFLAVGLLPGETRDAYRLGWTPAHQAAHGATCLWLRGVTRALPRRLRVSPVHDLAMARAEGRWPSQAAA